MAAGHAVTAGAYPVASGEVNNTTVLSWEPLWEALLSDLGRGTEAGVIAARFHAGLASALADTAIRVAQSARTRRIVLSGGVMQNRLLTEMLHARLTRDGFTVLVQSRVPANDGGLSLGQAAIAAVSGRQAAQP